MEKEEEHPEYQYLNLLREILEKGYKKVDRGTGVASYSLFGKQMRFDLSKGFPLLTTKKTYWKGILHELFWFLSGNTNIKYLVDNNVHIWDDYPYKIYKKKVESMDGIPMPKEEFIKKVLEDKNFAEKWGNLPRCYGEMWRRWPTKHGKTVDQVKWIVDEIREDPGAHNLIVNSWNPEYLYTMARLEDTSHFPICHNMYQVNIIDGKLSLHLYQRSADIFLGVPFNIASYALLAIVLAKITGYEPGEFIHSFGDVHIYENHVEQVKEQLSRTPLPLPTIRIEGEIKEIDDFKTEQVILENYNSHPPIKGELTVAGGFFEKKTNPETPGKA